MLLPFYENRKWGYIDEHAQMVIRPGFQGCGCFSEGVAPVCREGRYGYIDVSGREVIPGTFDWAGDFHEGWRAFKWGRSSPSSTGRGDC